MKNLRLIIFVFFFLTVCFVMITSPKLASGELEDFERRVNEAIKQGLDWLKEQQLKPSDDYYYGKIALRALAFLEHGYNESELPDNVKEDIPKLQELLNKEYIDNRRDDYLITNANHHRLIYEVSCAIMALAATHNPAYDNAIKRGVQFLVDAQEKFLFSIDALKFQSDLDSEKASKDLNQEFINKLWQEFKDDKILLKNDIEISIEEEDSRWKITAELMKGKKVYKKVYTVRKENDRLNIYQTYYQEDGEEKNGGFGWPYYLTTIVSQVDMTCTQFALLALTLGGSDNNKELAEKVDSARNKAKDFVLSLQNKKDENNKKEYGGFAYSKKEYYSGSVDPRVGPLYGSATAAGIWCLRLCPTSDEIKEVIKNAIRWFENNYNYVSENNHRYIPNLEYPKNPRFWLYYFYWSAAKAFDLAGTPSKAFDFSDKRSLLFRVCNLKTPAKLASKLRNAQDPLSQYLRGKFSEKTKQLLNDYDGSSSPSETLQKKLVDELNRLLDGDCLYDEQLFKKSKIELTREIQGLIEEKPKGDDLVRLNRLLLEKAYPDEITKCPEESWYCDFAQCLLDEKKSDEQKKYVWWEKTGGSEDYGNLLDTIFALYVLRETPDVSVEISPCCPPTCDKAVFNVKVTHNSRKIKKDNYEIKIDGLPDNFCWKIDDSNWNEKVIKELSTGEPKNLKLAIRPPAGYSGRAPITFSVTATSTSKPKIGDECSITVPSRKIPSTTATACLEFPLYDVSVTIKPESDCIQLGGDAKFTVTVTNKGTASNSYKMEITGLPGNFKEPPVLKDIIQDLPTGEFIEDQKIIKDLPAGKSKNLGLIINTPIDYDGHTPIKFSVTARSEICHKVVEASSEINLYDVSVTIKPENGCIQPGGDAKFIATVTNKGTAANSYKMDVTGLTGDFRWEWEPDDFIENLPAGESRDRRLIIHTHKVDGHAPIEFSVTATSKICHKVAEASSEINLYDVSVTIKPENGCIQPGGDAKFIATVTNKGTAANSYKMGVTGLPDDFRWEWEPDDFIENLPAGESRDRRLIIHTHKVDGHAPIKFSVTATSKICHKVAKVPSEFNLYGVSVAIAPTSVTIKQGKRAFFTVTVKNKGTVKDSYEMNVLELLFRVGSEFQNDLNNRQISEKLWQKFKKNNILLSKDATISIKRKDDGNKDVRWLITDNKQTYMIMKEVKKEKVKLNVYGPPKKFQWEIKEKNVTEKLSAGKFREDKNVIEDLPAGESIELLLTITASKSCRKNVPFIVIANSTTCVYGEDDAEIRFKGDFYLGGLIIAAASVCTKIICLDTDTNIVEVKRISTPSDTEINGIPSLCLPPEDTPIVLQEQLFESLDTGINVIPPPLCTSLDTPIVFPPPPPICPPPLDTPVVLREQLCPKPIDTPIILHNRLCPPQIDTPIVIHPPAICPEPLDTSIILKNQLCPEPLDTSIILKDQLCPEPIDTPIIVIRPPICSEPIDTPIVLRNQLCPQPVDTPIVLRDILCPPTVDTPIVLRDTLCPPSLDTPIVLQDQLRLPSIDTPIEIITEHKPHPCEGGNCGEDDDKDGKIDEEKYNHIDDDGDGFIDEDVECTDNDPFIHWIIVEQQDENHVHIKVKVSDPDGLNNIKEVICVDKDGQKEADCQFNHVGEGIYVSNPIERDGKREMWVTVEDNEGHCWTRRFIIPAPADEQQPMEAPARVFQALKSVRFAHRRLRLTVMPSQDLFSSHTQFGRIPGTSQSYLSWRYNYSPLGSISLYARTLRDEYIDGEQITMRRMSLAQDFVFSKSQTGSFYLAMDDLSCSQARLFYENQLSPTTSARLSYSRFKSSPSAHPYPPLTPPKRGNSALSFDEIQQYSSQTADFALTGNSFDLQMGTTHSLLEDSAFGRSYYANLVLRNQSVCNHGFSVDISGGMTRWNDRMSANSVDAAISTKRISIYSNLGLSLRTGIGYNQWDVAKYIGTFIRPSLYWKTQSDGFISLAPYLTIRQDIQESRGTKLHYNLLPQLRIVQTLGSSKSYALSFNLAVREQYQPSYNVLFSITKMQGLPY